MSGDEQDIEDEKAKQQIHVENGFEDLRITNDFSHHGQEHNQDDALTKPYAEPRYRLTQPKNIFETSYIM